MRCGKEVKRVATLLVRLSTPHDFTIHDTRHIMYTPHPNPPKYDSLFTNPHLSYPFIHDTHDCANCLPSVRVCLSGT